MTNDNAGLHLDLVHTSAVQYPVFIIVDPTVLVAHFTAQTTNINCLQTDLYRLKSRFFKVKGVPITSFKEYLVDESEETAETIHN